MKETEPNYQESSETSLLSDSQTCAQAAMSYCAWGWSTIPVQAGGKKPKMANWQKDRLSLGQIKEYFAEPSNVGVVLGDASGGLIDIDIDCSEASRIAPRLLLETGLTFGRKSAPRSHFLYVTEVPPRTNQFTDIDGEMLVEIRSTGSQTVLPPSKHESGEVRRWETFSAPLEIDGPQLTKMVSRLAAATLIARHWQKGSRHDAALALSGLLLKAGWDSADASTFMGAVVHAAKDEESAERLATVQSTEDRIADGKPVVGAGELAELMGDKVVEKVSGWLDLRDDASLKHVIRNSSPLLIPISDFMEQVPPKVTWLWEPFIAEGLLTVVASEPKKGKSTLLAHLVRAMCKGSAFLGQPTRKPTAVWIFSEERQALSTRIQELSLLAAAEDSQLPLLISARHPSWKELVAELSKAKRGTLVILDTIHRFWSIENENDAAQVDAAMNPLIDVAQERSLALVLVHHLGKGAGNSLRAIRGSSAIGGAVDIACVISPIKNRPEHRKIRVEGRFKPLELTAQLTADGYYLDQQIGPTRRPVSEAVRAEGRRQRKLRPFEASIVAALERALGEESETVTTANLISERTTDTGTVSPIRIGIWLDSRECGRLPRRAEVREWIVTREFVEKVKNS